MNTAGSDNNILLVEPFDLLVRNCESTTKVCRNNPKATIVDTLPWNWTSDLCFHVFVMYDNGSKVHNQSPLLAFGLKREIILNLSEFAVPILNRKVNRTEITLSEI